MIPLLLVSHPTGRVDTDEVASRASLTNSETPSETFPDTTFRSCGERPPIVALGAVPMLPSTEMPTAFGLDVNPDASVPTKQPEMTLSIPLWMTIPCPPVPRPKPLMAKPRTRFEDERTIIPFPKAVIEAPLNSTFRTALSPSESVFGLEPGCV